MFASVDPLRATSNEFRATFSGASSPASTRWQRNPFGPHTKPLAGPGAHRSARVGALRIVFTVDRDRRFVDVSDIGPRGQIYRGL